MAVHIQFDDIHNAIQPTLVLATRGGKKLGIIKAGGISFSDNLSSGAEMQFQVYKESNGVKCNLWDEITDLKLVWSPEWDLWFEIDVEVSEQDESIKNVSAITVGEAELSQINLYETEINTELDISRDDYVPTTLYNIDNADASLLHRVLSKAPHYTIEHVDDSLKNIQRTFEFDNISIYDALQQIGTEIDCLFVIDSGSNSDGTIARKISVYDLCSVCLDCGERGSFTDVCPECGSANIYEGYGEDTNIFVSVDNLANEITYTTDKDSVKNCFRLVAGDDLMTAAIKNCNPNGSNYIWYITDETRKDMSDALRTKLTQYDAQYRYYRDTHSVTINTTATAKYNALVNKYRAYDPDIELISNPMVGHSALIHNYYNALDFRIYLENTLMPSVEMSSTSATEQAAKLISRALTPVAVTSVRALSEATASSAVLSMAKVIVDSRYQVKVKSSSLSGTTWTGSFTVTNYSDDEDTADSQTVTVTINDSYETFVKQKLTKAMSDQSDEVTDIGALFDLDLAAFKAQIKKYCLVSLNQFNDSCLACMNILIEQGISDGRSWAASETNLYDTLYIPYYNKQLALQDEIKLREDEIAIVDGRYDNYGAVVTDGMGTLLNKQIYAVQSALDFEKYMGVTLMKELSAYRREDAYENSNYISTGLNNAEIIQNAVEFLGVAENELIKSATLQHSISTSLNNLLIMKEFARITDYFKVGNWIRIRVDGRVYKLRLVSYEIDFDNLERLSVDFSDVTHVASGASDIESILSKASSMSSSYDSVTRQALKGSTAKDSIDGWISRGLALTKMKIVDSAINQNIQIDERGLLCREYLPLNNVYDSKQLRIINRGLYLTDDGWYTSRAGIGDFMYFDPSDKQEKEAYGIVADILIGNLILSETVGVYNKSGSIKLDENGLTLISRVSGTTNVFKVQREAIDGTLTDVIYFDNSGNAHFNGAIEATSGSFYNGDIRVSNANGEVVIHPSVGIAVGKYPVVSESNNKVSINSSNAQFWMDSNGNANFSGKLSAASGTFAGELSAATGTFKGELSAATGTFEGELSAACLTSGTIDAARIGTGTITATKLSNTLQNTINGANGDRQLIYISKSSGTSSVTAPTSWVTNATGNQNTWTIKRPTYNSNYPVLFVATQSQTVGGTLECTTPQIDNTTTVIDGGHITTGAIDANLITTGTLDASKATITNLNASNIKSGTLSASYINGGTLTLGGSGNGNGVISVKNASGTEIGRWDNSGITISNGSVSASTITSGSMSAARITSGTMSADRISGGSIDATNVTITNLNASNITSGEMSAQRITSGTMSAARISGGTLTLGGANNGNGVISVKNASGTEIGRWDRTGITISSGSVSADTITSGSMSAARITSGTMSADRISGGTIDASKITVSNLSASSITSGSMSAARITSGTMSADRISGGTIDASKVTVSNLNASNITSGTMSASRITSGTMSADRISGGTIDASKVTVSNLSASSITTGTLSASRISGGTLDCNNLTVKNLTADSISGPDTYPVTGTFTTYQYVTRNGMEYEITATMTIVNGIITGLTGYS